MSRVCLVTGGAGFIGSHLVEALRRRGDRVRVLDDFSTGNRDVARSWGASVDLVEGSITDPAAAARAVAGADFVFHEAALPSVVRSLEDPLATHAACATGTLVVLDAARRAGVKRVVYAASSSAYGNQPFATKRETDLPAPLSPYAAAKLAGEYYCRAFTESFGLETVGLRYFNVFGPRQNSRGPYAGVIPAFISRLLAGQSATIHGDGLQTRDFTYVENVVSANLLAAEAPRAVGLVLNVASGQSTSVLDLYNEIGATLGVKVPPTFAPARAGDVRSSLADLTLTREVLSYEPRVTLRQGLSSTIEYYRQQV